MVTVVTCVVNRPTQFWQAYVLFTVTWKPGQNNLSSIAAQDATVYMQKGQDLVDIQV